MLIKRFESPLFSVQKICYAGIFIQVLTCYFSVGYHNPDEHWQLLEFAAYKLGFAPLSDMPWEVAAKSRQAILPFFVYLLGKAMLYLNCYNPFSLAFILRLISGILAYSSMMLLIFRVRDEFKSENTFKIVVFLANFLWFIPYIHARFQSENWTGIFLTFAIYFLYPTTKHQKQHNMILFLVGFLLGLAFIIRIQTGLALFGLGIWLLVFCRLSIVSYLSMAFGFGIMCFLGTWIDYWFYGIWTFTPYTYFDLQVVQSICSNWGVFPWWYYFYLFVAQVVPLESILLLGVFMFAIVKNPKHIISWTVFFFLAGHSYITYKEVRYLYPLVSLFVVLIGLGISQQYLKNIAVKVNQTLILGILYLVLVQNSILLVVIALKPANEIVNIQKFIYEEAKNQPVVVFVKGNESPFEHGNTKYNFYSSKNIIIKRIENSNEIIVSNQMQGMKCFFAEKSVFLSENFKSDKIGNAVFRTIPAWLTKFNINNWLSRARVWSVYEITEK